MPQRIRTVGTGMLLAMAMAWATPFVEHSTADAPPEETASEEAPSGEHDPLEEDMTNLSLELITSGNLEDRVLDLVLVAFNEGSSVATDLSLDIVLEDGWTLDLGSADTACSLTGSTAHCSLALLESGDAWVVILSLQRSNEDGGCSLTAALTQTQDDLESTDNTVTVELPGCGSTALPSAGGEDDDAQSGGGGGRGRTIVSGPLTYTCGDGLLHLVPDGVWTDLVRIDHHTGVRTVLQSYRADLRSLAITEDGGILSIVHDRRSSDGTLVQLQSSSVLAPLTSIPDVRSVAALEAPTDLISVWTLREPSGLLEVIETASGDVLLAEQTQISVRGGDIAVERDGRLLYLRGSGEVERWDGEEHELLGSLPQRGRTYVGLARIGEEIFVLEDAFDELWALTLDPFRPRLVQREAGPLGRGAATACDARREGIEEIEETDPTSPDGLRRAGETQEDEETEEIEEREEQDIEETEAMDALDALRETCNAGGIVLRQDGRPFNCRRLRTPPPPVPEPAKRERPVLPVF
jgi:hypothetical protein